MHQEHAAAHRQHQKGVMQTVMNELATIMLELNALRDACCADELAASMLHVPLGASLTGPGCEEVRECAPGG